jgi:hypothetical protein
MCGLPKTLQVQCAVGQLGACLDFIGNEFIVALGEQVYNVVAESCFSRDSVSSSFEVGGKLLNGRSF